MIRLYFHNFKVSQSGRHQFWWALHKSHIETHAIIHEQWMHVRLDTHTTNNVKEKTTNFDDSIETPTKMVRFSAYTQANALNYCYHLFCVYEILVSRPTTHKCFNSKFIHGCGWHFTLISRRCCWIIFNSTYFRIRKLTVHLWNWSIF